MKQYNRICNRGVSFLFVFICGLLCPWWAQAQGEGTGQQSVTPLTAEGVYKGTMEVLMEKSNKQVSREAVYRIEDGILRCDFPQIGKMPGKIRIELPLTIGEDGTMVAEPEAIAGQMKMPMGVRIKLRCSALDEAKTDGHTIAFILKVYGKFMGVAFPTTVHFTGTKE